MACSDRRREAHNDSHHETSHCFSGRVLPRRTAECRSDRPLPSLELVTHKTHKRCQTGAYRTLNKRGHIPGVFPHEVTSCSRGRMGCWEFTGDLLRRTLPPPKVLSALFMFFFSFSLLLFPHYFHLSIHLYPPVPLSVSLPVELWILIWRFASTFTVLWHLFYMIWQVSLHTNNRWLLFSGNPLLCLCAFVCMCTCVLRTLHLSISWKGRVSQQWERVTMIERMKEGKRRRRRLERVLLPYMGICTALLVVGSKTWSSFFRKHSTTQPRVRCITQHRIM